MQTTLSIRHPDVETIIKALPDNGATNLTELRCWTRLLLTARNQWSVRSIHEKRQLVRDWSFS